MLGRKTKRKEEGSRRKDQPSSSQEDRTICNCKRKTNDHAMEETGTNMNRDKHELQEQEHNKKNQTKKKEHSMQNKTKLG